MALKGKSDPNHPDGGEGLGGELLAAVRIELADERARKASLESRALTLSAAAAAVIALIFGLGTDYDGRWQAPFFVILGVSGLCFLAAAMLGWWAARITTYDQPQIEEFRRLLDEGWDKGVDELQTYVADGVMTALESARTQNDKRADALERAFFLLIAGSSLVGVELVLVVLNAVFD